jgi:predicted acyltransferase
MKESKEDHSILPAGSGTGKSPGSAATRLYSLDALRGFDMLWITGGQKLVFALATVTGWPLFEWMNSQMHHVEWNGFAFYDMIFPLFLFLAGVSMPYSFASRTARGDSRRKLYLHTVKRMVVLVILGMLVNRILELNPDNLRFASVLGRIGIAWFLAAMIVLNTGIRWQVAWFWGLLIIYCLLMLLVPVPGFGAGVLTPEGNLAGWLDRLLLPGTMYTEFNEPEGILSTVPSVSTALLGVFAGHLLRLEREELTGLKKGMIIIGAGIISLLLGILWGTFFPINKNLWTSSFVLFAGGWSLMLLGLFYLIIDVRKIKKWAFFFVVIGMNSITIYVLQNRILRFDIIRDFFLKGVYDLSPATVQPFISSLGYIAVVWLFLWFLYRNRIFLKV